MQSFPITYRKYSQLHARGDNLVLLEGLRTLYSKHQYAENSTPAPAASRQIKCQRSHNYIAMSNPDLPHPPNFPWYAIYTEAVDAVYLTLIILRHAELVTAAAVAARAVLAAERQRQVLCFDLVEMDEDDDNNPTASDVSVDLSSPFIDHIRNYSR